MDRSLAERAVDRGVSILGIDTMTPDIPAQRRGSDFDYEIRRALPGNGVLIAENLRNAAGALPGPGRAP